MADVGATIQEMKHTGSDALAIAPGIPNHKFGMWLFLTSEVMFFTGLLGTYLVLRLSDPEGFAEQASHLNWQLAALNTLVLIFSSLTMALAIHWSQEGDRGKTRLFLLITIACALGFMVIKGIEYNAKFSHTPPILPKTHVFFASYFACTGVHAIHVIGGVVPLTWMLLRVSGGGDVRRNAGTLECIGLYWHFVDLVWIFLFPLFYLLPSHAAA